MAMHQLFGHREARRRIIESVAAGKLPQVILITGPEGVGKQRFGLWLAQLLFCPNRTPEGPCGSCRPCRLVLGLAHPDLHWFIPIPRPKAGASDKQVEEAGELLSEVLAERRERPLYQSPDGMHLHPIASAKLLMRRAALTPVEGSAKVFVMGEADRLVAQEGGDAAANALLKFLEEPPADTWIVLTATEPERVLPTIRSRAVPLRLARLPEPEIRSFAESRLDPVPAGTELDLLVRHADGAIGKLVGSAEAARRVAEEARAVIDAATSKGGARFERSLRQAPWSARGGFTDLLDAVAAELSLRAREAAQRDATGPYVTALERVQAARAEAQGNVNPQLLLAVLTADLAEVLEC
jgi:DNA polymerase-3 subunit delta'